MKSNLKRKNYSLDEKKFVGFEPFYEPRPRLKPSMPP